MDDKATDLANAVYTYTITSAEVYQLTKVTDNIDTGFVTLVDGSSVVVGNKEVTSSSAPPHHPQRPLCHPEPPLSS